MNRRRLFASVQFVARFDPSLMVFTMLNFIRNRSVRVARTYSNERAMAATLAAVRLRGGMANAARPVAALRIFLAVLLWLAAGSAFAQDKPAILAPGEAAVTGFSGVQVQTPLPPGADPSSKTFIDLNGFSLRVVDLRHPGAPPNAQVLTAPKPFSVTAQQVGQVFAVALDNDVPPNIYVAATSVYGLPIVALGGGSQLLHVRHGGPRVSFMAGLFGPSEQDGGPGSIWKIDGVSGQVSLFANVTTNGALNSGPALGGLAFDPGSGDLFVADRETGLIHRFDLTGAERAVYDHGTQGRAAAGLPPVPDDPSKRLDITKPQFDSGNPATWFYAPPERLIFGLGVWQGRLYYAVASGLQIWSVSITPDGSFGSDARLEITVPPGTTPTEISKITFDDDGRMLLAERPAPTGDFGFTALSDQGVGRVLRYARVQPDDKWQPAPDEYAIGFPLQMRNGNGGVAVGHAYNPDGTLDLAHCGGFLWSTGEQLRVTSDPTLAAQLAQGGPAVVNGLQGNAVDLVRPANAPPLQSYFVDYDDLSADPDARGHMGDVAIVRACGFGGRFGWDVFEHGFGFGFGRRHHHHHEGPPPPNTCVPGKPGYQCCPEGTYMDANGQCVSACPASIDPNGYILGHSYSYWCQFGIDPTTFKNNGNTFLCLGGSAPDPNVLNSPFQVQACLGQSPYANPPTCPAGYTKTTFGQFENDNKFPALDNVQICEPTPAQQNCTPGQQIGLDNKCDQLCPNDGTAYPTSNNSICCPANTVPNPVTGGCCPPGSKPQPDGSCSPPPPPGGCPPQYLSNGRCCMPPSVINPHGGACCPPGSTPQPDGSCSLVPQIPPGGTCPRQYLDNDGECCLPPKIVNPVGRACCPAGSTPQPDGSCRPRTGGGCPSGTTLDSDTGQCCSTSPAAARVCHCLGDKVLIDGKCRIPPLRPFLKPRRERHHCSEGHHWEDGRCVIDHRRVEHPRTRHLQRRERPNAHPQHGTRPHVLFRPRRVRQNNH